MRFHSFHSSLPFHTALAPESFTKNDLTDGILPRSGRDSESSLFSGAMQASLDAFQQLGQHSEPSGQRALNRIPQ